MKILLPNHSKTMTASRHTFFLLVSMMFISMGTMAQSARLRAANKQFENMSYLSAVRGYEEFLRLDRRKDPVENREALINLGYSYRRLQDTRNAERVYAELVTKYEDLPSEAYLYYAQSLAANKHYRESQKMYAKYGEMQKEDLRGRKFTVSYMDVSRFYQDSSSYKVEYLPINSRQADFSPMYYKGGLVFVSARDETGIIKRVFNYNQTPFLDLYFHSDTTELLTSADTEIAAGSLSGSNINEKENVPVVKEQTLSKTEIFSRTINTKYHEGPVTFFSDQKRVIFTRNNDDRGKSGKSGEGVRKLKLYYAEQDSQGRWINIKELPFNSKDYSCAHPALSADDSKLYFVSDMPGGYGGTDLYVVDFIDGEWGSPVNMGREVNTEGNEMFPYLDAQNMLYFSSDGHEGLGGLDVFVTELKDNIAIMGATNIGAPINSEGDDFGLITNADRSSGYFSSNRKRAGSDDNIYSFTRICKELNIYVFDAKTKAPIEAADLRVVKNGVNQQLQKTGMDGSVRMCLERAADYEMVAIKEGYASNHSLRFSTLTQSANPSMGLSIYLDKDDNSSLVKGVIRKEVDQQPADGVKVTLRNEKKNSEKTVTTGADGSYEFDMDPNSNYTITTEKDKYTSDQNQIKTKKRGEIVQNNVGIYGEGDVFRLENIYYDFDKFFIRPDAAQELNRVALLLKKYPQMTIELRSHTDSRSSGLYNDKLSERRARAAYDYLVRRGVSPMRMTAKGYGESQPVNDCIDGENCTESEHKLNRRTEFKIISIQ